MGLRDSKTCVFTSTSAGFILHVLVFLSAAFDVNQSRMTALPNVSMKLMELSKKEECPFFRHDLFTCTREQLLRDIHKHRQIHPTSTGYAGSWRDYNEMRDVVCSYSGRHLRGDLFGKQHRYNVGSIG
jgi:hypothetical protein